MAEIVITPSKTPLPAIPDLPFAVHIVAWVMVIATALWIIRDRPHLRTPQGEIIATPVVVTVALSLILMRYFNTATVNGVMLHFLGATIATLMFGRSMACLIMAGVSLSGVVQQAAWHGWASDFVVTGFIPIMITATLSDTARRWLPRNIFSYVMINAFFSAVLAMSASILCKAIVAVCLGSARAAMAYIQAMPLLMFAEAFFAGVCMVLVVVYRPQWCSSFDDRLYLWPQRQL